MEHGHWKDIHQVVVERETQATFHSIPGNCDLRLDLVAPDQGNSGGEEVQKNEGQAEEEVDGEGEENREEWGLKKRNVLLDVVPQALEKHGGKG